MAQMFDLKDFFEKILQNVPWPDPEAGLAVASMRSVSSRFCICDRSEP